MSNSSEIPLPDFDTLKKMHEENPEALNALQREVTAQLISNASGEELRRILTGIQWQLNVMCAKIKNPLVRVEKISTQMNQSFIRLNQVFKDNGLG